MTTKYQIIVTKLETIVHNITRTTEAKKRLRMRRAIHKFAENAEQNRMKKANKQRLVYLHFENKISSMVAAFERFTM